MNTNVPKQDRIRPRTVEDLERMYKFGKRTEEMKGFATRSEMQSVKGELTEVGSRIPTKVGDLEDAKDYATTEDVKNATKDFASQSYVDGKVGEIVIPDISNLATQSFVTNKIAEAQWSAGDTDIDLSGFASLDDLKPLAKTSDLAEYAKSADVTQQISSATSGLASETYVDDRIGEVEKQIPKDYVKPSDLDAYVTETELSAKGYATTGAVEAVDKKFEDYTKTTDLERDYAKKTDLDSYAKETDIPTNTSDLKNDSGYVTETDIDGKGFATKGDVTTATQGLATKAEVEAVDKKVDNLDIPTSTSDLTNDSGFLTSIPSEYVTETELSNKGYLTSIPSEYVTEEELDGKNYATKNDVTNATSGLATTDQLDAVEDKVDAIKIPDISNLATKNEVTQQISSATSNLATQEQLNEVAGNIPTGTSELVNDSGYVSEQTVKDLISESSGFSMSVDGETLVLGSGGGISGDSGYDNDGDTSNDSSVNRTGEGENLTVYYSIDTKYLGTQGSMSIDGLTIEAGENSNANGTKFPLYFTSETDITQITIVTNRECTLCADNAVIPQDRSTRTHTWVGRATKITITCNVSARAESIHVITK